MEPLAFINHCKNYGITIERTSPVLTLTKRFTPSNEGFTQAETDVSIIYEAPGSGGSVWGTDGGSIGGMVAMQSGLFKLNKSGVKKRWLVQLQKLMAI